MRFPLDLIWLDKAGQVVRIDPSVPPRRLKTCLRARSVIEARGGTADAFVAAGLVARVLGRPRAQMGPATHAAGAAQG